MKPHDHRIARLITLAAAASRPEPGLGRIALAVTMGLLCHLLFTMAVLCMIAAMFFGMSKGLGELAWPWAGLANIVLILQFPLVHSWLLSRTGSRLLNKLVPGDYGPTLATTTYAMIASIQLLALFILWTPTGIILWQADGWLFWLMCSAYAFSWLLLAKSIFDAGLEVQCGALGWMSLMANIRPIFPDMPETGLFRIIRQPIYIAFALTLWTVPTWTPDQLVLAVAYTSYCLFAPRFKERRFALRYGQRFEVYRKNVPYGFPRLPGWRRHRLEKQDGSR